MIHMGESNDQCDVIFYESWMHNTSFNLKFKCLCMIQILDWHKENICMSILSNVYQTWNLFDIGLPLVILSHANIEYCDAVVSINMNEYLVTRILSVISLNQCDGSYMMMAPNGNIFRVTGLLCGEFSGPRWIPCTKASDAELWCFLWSVWINGWVNNPEAGDLRRYRAHYDVTVMLWHYHC